MLLISVGIPASYYMSYYNRAFISHASTDPDLGNKTVHDTFIRFVSLCTFENITIKDARFGFSHANISYMCIDTAKYHIFGVAFINDIKGLKD